jgi:hypothetical protein
MNTLSIANSIKGAGANGAAASSTGGGLNDIIQGLTGINLGDLGLRSVPELVGRKAASADAGTGKAAAKAVSNSLPVP